MKNALILLAVVALALITLGAFNREASIDFDYIFGVWRSINAFWLFLMAAGVVLAAGLLGASLARAQGWRERGKLEKELLEVYRRLRSAEAKVEAAAGAAGVAAAEAEAATVAAASEAPGGAGTTTVVSAPDEAATSVSALDEAATAVSAPEEATTADSGPSEATTEVRDAAGDAAAAEDAGEPRP